jgi:type IV pilus assembly protein PilE
VTIIGILAAIAYPAYQDYVLRAKRGDAMNGLAAIRIAQEKYRASNVSFATTVDQLTNHSSNTLDINYSSSPEGYYSIALLTGASLANASSFWATASASHSDPECDKPFLVDRNGKVTSDSNYAGANCWE